MENLKYGSIFIMLILYLLVNLNKLSKYLYLSLGELSKLGNLSFVDLLYY